jgi:acetoin utilization deacetylase AcuC-like enzyme
VPEPLAPTPIFRSDAHLAHAGLVELMAGRQIPCYEAPERAVEIERALAANRGYVLAEPGAFGTDPIMAVHDPLLVEVVEHAWTDALAAGAADGSRPPGRPVVVLQEGGYAIDAIGANAVAFLGGLREGLVGT